MQRALITLFLGVAPFLAHADLCVDQGAFTLPDTTGNQTVSGSSCTPKVLIWQANYAASENAAASAYDHNFGVGISSSLQATVQSRRSDGSQNADGQHTNDRILRTVNASAGLENVVSLVSLNSDGYTYNIIQRSSVQLSRVKWLTIGGSDLTNVNLVQYQSPTSTGTQSLTGAGFAPDAIIVFTAGISSAPPAIVSNGDTNGGVGYAVRDPAGQAAIGVLVNHVSTNASRAQSTSSVIYLPGSSDMLWEAAVSSWGSDGVTLNWSTTQGTAIYFWVLFLKGPRFRVFTTTQPTSSGNSSVTGIGFQPEAALLASFCGAAASGRVNDANWSLGMAYTPQKSAFIWQSVRAGGVATTASRANFNGYALGCYTEQGSSPTLRSRASLVSFDSDGLTLAWEVSESTQRQVIGLAIGPQQQRLVSPLLITRRFAP